MAALDVPHLDQLKLPAEITPAAAPEGLDATDREFLLRQSPPAASASPDFVVVDLFGGCGGLTYGALEGARRAGMSANLALAIDNDPAPLSVLRTTLPDHDARFSTSDLGEVLAPLAEPQREVERQLFGDVPEASLLLAGPPCQGHSALNNHTRHDDPRNDLYLAVARAARLLQPRAIVVENVRAVGSDRRTAVDRCTAALEEIGYEVRARRLNLHGIGVPQRRVRHVLVGTLERPFEWNLGSTASRGVGWAIEDLLDSEATTLLDTSSTPSCENQKRINWLFANDRYDLPNHLRPKCHQSKHSYRSMYGRLRWDQPAQTITSGFGSMGQGRYVHPLRPRTLTPHEAARLQFLPDFVNFEAAEPTRGALATMIGNAAPPLLTSALVVALAEQNLL